MACQPLGLGLGDEATGKVKSIDGAKVILTTDQGEVTLSTSDATKFFTVSDKTKKVIVKDRWIALSMEVAITGACNGRAVVLTPVPWDKLQRRIRHLRPTKAQVQGWYEETSSKYLAARDGVWKLAGEMSKTDAELAAAMKKGAADKNAADWKVIYAKVGATEDGKRAVGRTSGCYKALRLAMMVSRRYR